MPTSSIPDAIDYLVAMARALPECADPASVHDGFPAASGNPAIAIGVVPHENGDTPNDVVHAQLGAQMERETYDIPCEIVSWVGGADEAVKPARDAAFVIYNAFVTKVRLDRTLGGALHSGAAIVTGMSMDQTIDPQEAGNGRVCSIRFNVRCDNRF